MLMFFFCFLGGLQVERNPMIALIQTFIPLVAVMALATLNVFNGEGEGPALDNSIAIVFTLVIVLPELRPEGRVS